MKKKPFSATWALVAIGTIFLTGFSAFALNCDECGPKLTELTTKKSKMGRMSVILQKNKDYLAKNPGVSSSIAIKVRSNIVVATLQLETLDNEMQALTQDIKKTGCEACPVK